MTDDRDVNRDMHRDSRGDRAEFDRDDELRALLAATDPARSLPAADLAGLDALLEDTMSHDIETRPEPALEPRTGTHDRNPLTWLVAAAAVVVIAGVGALAASRLIDDGPVIEAGPGSDTPTSATSRDVTALAAPAASPGRCAAPSAELLAMSDVAFAGTVTAVDGDQVTLEASNVYIGEVDDTVTVTAPSAQLTTIGGAVQFQVGKDYLISGSDGLVSVCGLSGQASPQLQRLYEQASAG